MFSCLILYKEKQIWQSQLSLQTTVKMATDWQLHQEEMEDDKSGDKRHIFGSAPSIALAPFGRHVLAPRTRAASRGDRDSAEAVERTFGA